MSTVGGREVDPDIPGDVLHCVAPARVGGLERIVHTLASEQGRRGIRAGVAAVLEPNEGPHPFVARLRSASVPVEVVAVPHRAYGEEVRSIRRLLRRLEPDLVHTHGYRADVIGGNIARWVGLPVVSTVHGFTGGGWKNRFYEWLQRRSLARMDAVVAVSRPLGQELRRAGIDEERLHVVPNAWSRQVPLLERSRARQELGLPPEEFVVGWVGRLSPEKGPDVLVRCAAEVEGDVVFSILGDGPERELLEDLAHRLGVRHRVRFHGRVPDAAALYRAFDAFALSSRTEGTPVSLFEAIDASVPVVATRVGGVPDVVGPEEAQVVRPEDPLALAEALGRIRRDPTDAEARARRARRRLETEFSPGPWVDRYENIYRAAMDVVPDSARDPLTPGLK